jgi:hypothetical protein
MRKRLPSPIPLIDAVPLNVIGSARQVYELYLARILLRGTDVHVATVISARDDRITLREDPLQ